jgi:hypothetical protein
LATVTAALFIVPSGAEVENTALETPASFDHTLFVGSFEFPASEWQCAVAVCV